ncbi:MAG: LysM peptidoglycan-binding domain-containing protein [Roseburia sp.]|nr:LysM peptidoglycan-binding domain-containing protein [Roseburia sp.]
MIKGIAIIVILLFLCLMAGKSLWERLSGRVYYGEKRKWEYWTDCLLSEAKKNDYTYAFVWVSDETADFTWEFYEEREALVEDFLEKKEELLRKEKDAALWSFVKLRLDEDIYRTDIYEYIVQNLAEEGYECEAWTYPCEKGRFPDKEDPYYMEQIRYEYHEEEYMYCYILPKREVVVCDGYLYVLTCEEVTETNQYTAAGQLIDFRDWFDGHGENGRSNGIIHVLDYDSMYWMEHEERESRLEDPECFFIEKKASAVYTDGTGSHEWDGYFGLLSEAEYRMTIFSGMPEVSIHFSYAGEGVEAGENGYEFYLKRGESNADWYRMEVRIAENGELLQDERVQLSVWETDTIHFVDWNKDGYLDIEVRYHEYDSDEEQADDEGRLTCVVDYWLWNQEKETFMKKEAFWAQTDVQTPPYVLTVEKGDSLWKLAEEHYGDGSRWREIYEYNAETIGDDPSLILPGTVLEMQE